MSEPTPPIAIEGDGPARRRNLAPQAPVPDGFVDMLLSVCDDVRTGDAERAEAGRDWWPLAMQWALAGEVPGLPVAVARPTSAEEVAEVLRLCADQGVPVTAAGGRSGVLGASVPVFGGVVLDTTAMAGIVDVDETSMTVDVLPGTFGDDFEEALRARGLTCGHWPQSIALSTVGGWLACRGAGQLSNRYGKIEDIVVGLQVALADGTLLRTGGVPRAADGPDLTRLFVGSEGTLGVITQATLRVHRSPSSSWRSAWGFPTFDAANDACRRILQRGATPAVLRVYDSTEAARSYETGELHVLLAYDEGDPVATAATEEVVDAECEAAQALDPELVGRWFEHRNDVSALEALTRRGYVVDTMEITASWADAPNVYADTVAALRAVDGVAAASAHQSHAYADGACLYFTFAGKPATEAREDFYVRCWDAAQRAVLAAGGALSHHHGVGLNRSRFVDEALGTGGLAVLVAVKRALDPAGVLNPGKLGLPSPFGEVSWPAASPT
jgi:alkyldihydroxyacetonephosphate synthase